MLNQTIRMHPNPIVLASSSPYRRELLERLKITFECNSPNIDETPLTGELPQQLVERLALKKAHTIQEKPEYAQHIIIASDQCAVVNGHILGKPHTEKNAFAQLKQCSGQTVVFYTSVCVMLKQTIKIDVFPYSVTFRSLSDDEIQRYIEKEQPLNCAGSFKCEGLGISLFAQQSGEDPTALIGLPLIRTCEYLRTFGIACP